MISKNDRRRSSKTLAYDENEKVVVKQVEHGKGKKKKKKKKQKQQPQEGMNQQKEEEESDNAGADDSPGDFGDRPKRRSETEVQGNYLETGRATMSKDPVKLERKGSLRQKFGALIRRGGSELPAVINRSLKPIKRSLSFNKDLHRVRESSNVRWYSSLGSLAEDPGSESELETSNECELLSPRMQITRTRSLVDKAATTTQRRRSNTISIRPVSSYEHRTERYNSAIDLNKPPCQASSLPTLALSATDLFIREDDAEEKQPRSSEPSPVGNGWENWRASARNLSVLRLDRLATKPRSSVRSRSLTQLDVLGSSMLDTGEHRLGSGPPPLEQQPYHHHHHHHYHHQSHLHDHHQHQDQNQQQLQQPGHQQQQIHQLHHPQNVAEGSPRFLAPSASFESGQSNRRHKLSRSQVSSSEYFSVSIDLPDDSSAYDREEFLPATKGICLAYALTSVCERRGIDLSNVVVLDSFSSPLPLSTTDTSSLGGKHLRLTIAKEERPNSRSANQKIGQGVPLRKSSSGSYRGRSGRFFSISTEDSSLDSEVSAGGIPTAKACTTGSATLKASKQRWSGFFGNTKGTKLDLLAAQLDEYNKHGVPGLTDINLPYELSLNEDGLYDLEEDWRDIVRNSEELSEKKHQQQTALWELAQTEVAYIKTLKVVTDLFMACLCNLQASSILNEVDKTKLFSNIPEIYAANRYFWAEHVLVMVNASRSSGHPLDPSHLLQGFETFEQTFAPYTRYCSEQSKCQQYCRDRLSDNQLFTVYLVWCETRKDCNRLKLLDILVKPMQRLTKYSLLLKAVHKNTENEEQRTDLMHMIKSVDDFVASVNAAVKRNEEAARLASAASRLESYDVVESRDEELEKLIKIHSNFDITTTSIPGCSKDSQRVLLREGDLKLKDAATGKMEVHVLLLTDMLLICKSSTKRASSNTSSGSTGGGLKIVRQPYVVDRIRIYELKESSSLGLIYLNEYSAASAAFVLSAGEPKLAKSWMESLRKAQQQFALMKVPPLGSAISFGTVSRQPSTYLTDVDFETEECEGIPKTPRGSSRASRVSSLAHSHSGSMEMEGVSPGSSSFVPSYNVSRNVSVETNEPPRASSVSSEEGADGGSASGHHPRSLQISSNKLDNRRFLLSKSPTPNTLSVQVPAYSNLGQSLPNLTLATSPQTSTVVSPTPPNSLLIVPQITKSKDALLSPGHRGISYPPPSPPRGALRRAFAIPQSRNPPLIKTRHVNASVTQSIQPTGSLDTEAMEERRRRLEPSHRLSSMSTTIEEKK